jgi:hypothetical protein
MTTEKEKGEGRTKKKLGERECKIAKFGCTEKENTNI